MKRILKALLLPSCIYLGVWVLFGSSYLFWNTVASTSVVTTYSNQAFHSILSYLGLEHFKWTVFNITAMLPALIISYFFWLGIWFGIDRFLTNRAT
jgi:hypothetical protein